MMASLFGALSLPTQSWSPCSWPLAGPAVLTGSTCSSVIRSSRSSHHIKYVQWIGKTYMLKQHEAAAAETALKWAAYMLC